MALTGAERLADDPPVLVFDTDCVLCSHMVAFVLRHERDKALRFAGAWSNAGLALAARYGLTKADLDKTFLVVVNGRALTRSGATLAVATHLAAPWQWLRLLLAVPRPLRDTVYDFVARRRYRWFGGRADCTTIPSAKRERFLSSTAQ